MITVNRYGIHIDENNVAWIHQDSNAANVVGLKAKSPFFVKQKRKFRCPHQFSMNSQIPCENHTDWFDEIVNDPLVQALLPVSNKQLPKYFIAPKNNHYLTKIILLSRLCSPVDSIIFFPEQLTRTTLESELNVTNVAPLVIVGVQPKHTDFLESLITQSLISPRNIIMVGDQHLPLPHGIVKQTTDVLETEPDATALTLPYEAIGTAILRAHMRSEDTNIDWKALRERRKGRRFSVHS